MNTFPPFETDLEPGIEPYWTAAADNRLVVSRCRVENRVIWPPRDFCPVHGADAIDWVEASGRAVVYSHTTVSRGEAAFSASAPYVLAVVELEEGPRVLTNIVPFGEVSIGQSVQAVFEHSGSVPVLRFAIAED